MFSEFVESGNLAQTSVEKIIKAANFDLLEKIPRRYIRFLYELIIQVTPFYSKAFQVIEALDFAHKQNYTHGNLSLEHIYVQKLTNKKNIFKVGKFTNQKKNYTSPE